jgi:hypothetical protein
MGEEDDPRQGQPRQRDGDSVTSNYLLPFDWRIEIAPGVKPDGDPSLWAWEDIGSYRRQSADIELNYGRADESEDVEAADSNFTVDLRDGLLSARNPNSRLYGKIGPNTPIRYRLPKIVVDSFTRTVSNGWGTSDTGQTWTANSAMSVSSGTAKVALSGSGTNISYFLGAAGTPVAQDIDVVYSISISAVPVGGTWVSAAYLRYVDPNNFNRMHMEFRPDGTVSVKINVHGAGISTDVGESLATGATFTVGQKVWVRTQAIGPYLRVKVWNGAKTDEPLLFQVNAQSGAARGGGFGFLQWRPGVTNAGAITVTIDDLQVDAFVWSGDVPEFPPRWDKSGDDASASLVAAGPFRRFNQGDAPTQSALRRQLPNYAPVGYWPFEDSDGATSAASALANGVPAVVTGPISFAADSDSLPGSLTMAKFGSDLGMTVTGTVKDSSGVGLAGLNFARLPALPAADTVLIEWRTYGTVVRWRVIVNGTGMYLQGFDGTGATLVSTVTSIYPTGIPLGAFSAQLETSQSGGNIAYTLIVNAVGIEDFFVMANGTVAGTAGKAKGFYIPGSVGLYDSSFGQVWIGPNTLPYVDPTFLLVSSGYKGELATDRLLRLFAEQGRVLSLAAGAGEPMGAQKPGNFLDLIKETAKTDGGILYETGSTLAYLPRVARYNPPVSLVIDWAAGGFDEAPEPTDDDQRLRNRVTVSREGGSSATAEDADSIDKHGAVPGSETVNTEDDSRLAYLAQWYTSLGSVDEMRWPVLKINLIKHPEYIPAVLSMLPGARIQVINPKEQLEALTIDLIVEGFKHTLGRYAWDVELNCSPATPWGSLGVYDGTARRYDSRTAKTSGTLTTTAVSVGVTAGCYTDCYGTATPYNVTINGEVVTVTAAGAISGSGTGPYTQTLTVTRSVNGIVKTHAANERIRIASPGRYGL